MTAKENNERRCIAHQLIHDLYNKKELGQIQLLYLACTLAYRGLSPKSYRKALEDQILAIKEKEGKP